MAESGRSQIINRYDWSVREINSLIVLWACREIVLTSRDVELIGSEKYKYNFPKFMSRMNELRAGSVISTVKVDTGFMISITGLLLKSIIAPLLSLINVLFSEVASLKSNFK